MPATFSRALAIALAGLINSELFCFIDEIIVSAKSFEERLLRLRNSFMRLRKAVLKLQPEKCEFFKKEVKYLGHTITVDRLKLNEKNIIAAKNFPVPRTSHNIKKFYGMGGYYRRFI